MADQTGRCRNVEFCGNASSQRLLTIAEGAPFECPKCGEPLQEPKLKRLSGRKGIMLGVQLLVLTAGGGAVGYKLLGAGGAAPSKGAANPAVAAAVQTAPEPPGQAPADALAQDAAQAQPPTAPRVVPAMVVQTPSAQIPPGQIRPGQLPLAQAASGQSAPANFLVRMAGSDAVASRLARRLASGYLGLIGDSDITLVPGPAPDSVALTANQAGEREAIGITSGTTASGFAALLRGSADIALASRAVAADEVEKLASVGDMTDPASEHVIAVQGIAAIVSPANRIVALSLPQLRRIYAGEVTDWSQVGGAAGPIRVYLETTGSGTRETASDILMRPGHAPANGTSWNTEAQIPAHVAADRFGLALVALDDTGTARVLPVSGGDATTPIAPTDITISTEDYPLTRRLYFYTGPAPSNFVRRFTDYAASANGQAAVEAAGFVPLTVKAEAEAVPVTASGRFRSLVSGATRLSVDFRFQPGSTALDTRGARDLERLVSYLRSQHVSPNRLILAGFADGQGAPQANVAVSQKRMDAVRAALSKAGVAPGHAESFGAELPVADNATAEGRERNRRVEVYLAAE